MLSEHKLLSMLERDENKLARIQEKAKETTEHAFQAVAVVGVAGGLGYVNNRFGVNGNFLLFQKLPLDLTIGVGLHVLAFAGAMGRKYSEITHDAADGALAAYGYRLGSTMGATALVNAGNPPKTTQGVAGSLSQYGGGAYGHWGAGVGAAVPGYGQGPLYTYAPHYAHGGRHAFG